MSQASERSSKTWGATVNQAFFFLANTPLIYKGRLVGDWPEVGRPDGPEAEVPFTHHCRIRPMPETKVVARKTVIFHP